ncbi:hypothetical protein KDA_30970 [Dictyobacter alpinus]|uniref:Carrier domain-containing protein n=1 Tax=Dictyobacter alpinus TaxID=2014873 RepID=A0A402B875_9CHLR|nr:non-ribosomal peptide synthetase [Dictyobacter alpinus]GCE27613.1 hypothetical protein KDA_30970 [Dictyobacter alpinus]
MTQIEEQRQSQSNVQAIRGHHPSALEEIAAPLRLPYSRGQSQTSPFLDGEYAYSLGGELVTELRQASLSAQVSSQAFLFAAFQALLYRYTLREDFICGLEMQDDDGQLAMQVHLRGEMSADDLVQRVQTRLDVSERDAFSSLHESSSPQVIFRLVVCPPTEYESRQISEPASGCEVLFELTEDEQAIHGSIHYTMQLFDATAIVRMAGHFQRILEGMVQNPVCLLSHLPLLTDKESEQLRLFSTQTAVDGTAHVLVQQAFEQWAERTPAQLALTSDTRSLSYGKLNVQANQLAHYLQSRGVGPETLVALYLPRSIELIVGMLGILKAGGAYVPVDPSTPPERLSFLLQDTGVPCVLTTHEQAGAFTDYVGSLLYLPDEVYARESGANLVSDVGRRNSAYIIYTSGSTGTPKGVQIEHQSLTNLCRWHQRAFAITLNDRASQVAGINFDAAGWEIWPYLTAGASVHFVDEETRITPEKLQAWFIAHSITIGFLPTPLMESVQHLTWPQASPLRCLLTGGDRLHRFPSPMLPFEIVNNYGPTENTVVSTSTVLPKCETAEEAPSIGGPIDNTTAHILDPWMNPVPIGVAGELYVGGIGIARGYHGRPDLTAERFLPDHLGKQPGARLYRTGDLVCYRLDGTIEFLERIDFQVKIRGFRIELGEIETSLSSHPTVGDVIVLVREDEDGEKQLIAYLVSAHSTHVSPSELRTYLRQRLPSYMIPSDFIWMEQFPLTLNGKVDRQKLSVFHQQQVEEQCIKPRTEMECSLAEIWQDVLHIECVSVEDDFFALGGYSLQATRIIARIRQAFSVEVPLHHFFRTPTIARLADYVEHDAQAEPHQPGLALTKRSSMELPPLSFAQERLWFLHQLAPQSDAYNIPVAFHLRGPVDHEALTDSLNMIIARHEVLRTLFRTIGGVPVQTIVPQLSISLVRHEVSAESADERMAQAIQLVSREAHIPFDLVQGPLLRATLVQVGEQEHVFFVNMHHSITDGWSLGVLCHELGAYYRALTAGVEPDLPPLPLQYADYAVWQRQWLQGAMLHSQLEYWKKQLQGAPAQLSLSLEQFDAGKQTAMKGKTRSLLLPQTLVQALARVCTQEKATLFMALLTAFKMQLCLYTGQTDLVLGTPVASRTMIEVEPLIGFFVNMLVLRTKLEGDPTYQQVLQQVRTTALEAYAHQDLPFEMLVDALQLQRSVDHNPLFQVVFALQDTSGVVPAFEQVTVEPLTIQLEDALFDLSVEVKEVAEGYVVTANYTTNLFDDETMQHFLDDYERLLQHISRNPSLHLSELSPSPVLPIPQTYKVIPTETEKRHEQMREHTGPRTPLEEILVASWSQILKKDDMSIWDNFFEIGGHSLLAAQLVSRLHDIFEIDLSVRIIFQAPTVAGLAEELVRCEPFPGQFSLIAEIYQQVDALSDDETLSALQQKRSDRNEV